MRTDGRLAIMRTVGKLTNRRYCGVTDANIIICLPMLNVGGTEVATLRLVEVLVAAGAQVTVLSFYESDDSMVAAFADAGASVQLLGRRRGGSGLALMRELFALMFALRHVLRERRPDVVHVQYVAPVHVQYVAPALVPIVAARLAGVKRVVGTVHQSGQLHRRRARFLFRLAARFCTRFTCVSGAVEESWFGARTAFAEPLPPSCRHVTLYNGVDTDGIAAAVAAADPGQIRAGLKIAADAPVIGVVARLSGLKGLDFFLDVMRNVAAADSRAVCVVVGDGQDRDPLRARAVELGIADRMRWLGKLPQDRVFAYLSVMDVVAVPSRSEGLGLSAIEAAAAGRAVVATKVGGLPEVIADGETGILVDYGDVNAFSDAVLRLLADASGCQALGQRAREQVADRFGLTQYGKRVLMLYESLCR